MLYSVKGVFTMKEIWKDIAGYEGYYQVSNLGNVRSLDRIIKGSLGQPKRQKGKAVNPRLRGSYMAVTFSKDNEPKTISVHRLVAIAFVENPNNYPCVNHKDENKLNNNADNLEWCTKLYNSNYGNCRKKIGEANRIKRKGKPSPKLENSKKSRWIILVNTGEEIKGIKTASLKYNINRGDIGECCRGKKKFAGKINGEKAVWKYK